MLHLLQNTPFSFSVSNTENISAIDITTTWHEQGVKLSTKQCSHVYCLTDVADEYKYIYMILAHKNHAHTITDINQQDVSYIHISDDVYLVGPKDYDEYLNQIAELAVVGVKKTLEVWNLTYRNMGDKLRLQFKDVQCSTAERIVIHKFATGSFYFTPMTEVTNYHMTMGYDAYLDVRGYVIYVRDLTLGQKVAVKYGVTNFANEIKRYMDALEVKMLKRCETISEADSDGYVFRYQNIKRMIKDS